MASNLPEESQLSDKKVPDYTDASSLPISSDGLETDSGYRDASSVSVAADGAEEDNVSTSSSSYYVDAGSSPSPEIQVPVDPPYVDAVSTDSRLTDEQVQGSAGQPDMNRVIDQYEGSGDHQHGERHVYFELEKTKDTGVDAREQGEVQTEDARFKRQSLATANVNVAERARLFEVKPSFGDSDAAAKEKLIDHEDIIYEVPPALKTESQTNTPLSEQTVADGGNLFATDEDIYEITFHENQSNQANSFQSSGEASGVYETVGNSVIARTPASRPTMYELAGPMATSPHQSRTSLSLPAGELSGSGGFISCKQGSFRQEKVQGVMPSQEEIQMEYNRLQFGRNAKLSPAEAGYNTLDQLSKSSGGPRDPTTKEPLYDCPENLQNRRSWGSDDWSDGSWGSSEFEDDEEGYFGEPDTEAPSKPLPRKPCGHEPGDSLQKFPGILNKFRQPNARSPVREDPDAICLTVNINTLKHPPPELPPAPPGLTESQKKRRCVVELTISSERSYIESLERIVQEYEKQILDLIPNAKSPMRMVFREAKEILNHHKMFQIELSETVRKWDTQEKIGDIFTASFSKSMLVDAYSIYVNNFAAGMDEIRTVQQNRPAFEEFLKFDTQQQMKEKSSYDRLSIFGLMVKPVQRFPQFILLIQDLIKYTPPSHHDRQALQLALTELENVTHKLNERKRLSEQYFQAKQTMQLLPRQLPTQVLSSRNMEKPRRLIRFDNFDQIDGEMENMKSSSRRLILMDDMVICVKVGFKDQDGFMMERYRLKWAVRLCDVELKDTAMTPDMRNVVKMDSNRLRAITSQLEKHEEDPFHLYADLRDMLHDLAVFGQITNHMQSLRRSYQGYNMSEELFHEVTSDLQRMIQIKDEQLRLVNSCSIILVDNSKTDKPHYVMQAPTAAVKNEWCVDFNMAKLSIEKQNKPGWDRSPLAGSDDLEPVPAVFMKCVPVDVPRNFTKVKCAIPVFMPAVPHVNSLGVQHLWVCTSTPSRGQVSVVSLNNTRPALTESFKACECEVLCAEVVSGCGQETHASRFLFSEDTVWMSNTRNEIVIFPLSSGGGGSTAIRDPLAVVRVPGRVTSIKFVDERLFCGLDSGVVLVYSRNDVGEWCIKSGRSLELGRGPVKCQLVVKDDLWIACGRCVHVVQIDSLKTLATHQLSGHHETSILQIVRSGVGVWVAFLHSPAVRLFHLESMENLQEMSVANIINRVLAEKSGSSEVRDCVVTCIAASTGLLWIGTSVGLILTLPLPRLSDGVPLYSGRPSVAYHAHRGPVRFIIPVYCSGSILELHKNSSLRSNLRARPSLRNRKRELIELKGVAEENLLSSGTELEASQDLSSKPDRKGVKTSTPYMEVLLPKPSEVPESLRESVMRPRGGRKLFNFKRISGGKIDGRSSSLKIKKKGTNFAHRSQSRTLSFRSELADRIKRKSFGRFQSMFDLRSDDALEVEMLYENLLDVGDISEDDADDTVAEAFDDLSVRSDSATLDNTASSSLSLQAQKSKEVESMDLAVFNSDSAKSPTQPSTSSTSPSSTLEINVESNTSSKMKADTSESLLHQSAMDLPSPPPSPRIATIRAHTMRKTSTSNAVMVLSGGDGYWDMHSGGNFSKNEDASLLFWIYKF